MNADIERPAWERSGARVDAWIERIAEQLGVTVKASTIFGEPVERDGLTVIPVAKARWGFGGGGGSGHDEQGPGGGGGGMTMTPVGYIEIGGGHTVFRPIRDPRTYVPYAIAAGALIALLTRVLGRR
jgi:uncharacterized spore protein YtfJ